MNKKVHIALVGGQSMPVYLGINEFNPDSIILIHSEETHNSAKRFASEYPDKTELRCIAPVDMPAIIPAIDQLLQELEGDEVVVNLTGGTKPWTIAFTLQAKNKQNVHLIYVDQNCIFYNFSTGQKWLSNTRFNMQQLMDINGQIAKSHNILNDYDEDDFETLQIVKNLREASFSNFKALTMPNQTWQQTPKNHKEGSYCLKDGSYIDWNKSTNTVHIVLRKKWSWIDKELESPNVMRIVFNFGWFEYEIAEIISHWNYAKEIWLNVIYPYQAGQAKNEIDIIINTGVKLLMIECKTQISDNTDIDKFHTAVKNYGGMGCKSLFITEAPMTEKAKEKCADCHILAFSLKDYASIRQAQNELFSLLDKEIFNINAK